MQIMSHFELLGLEIPQILRLFRNVDGNTLRNGQSVLIQLCDLFRVVGHEPQRGHAQMLQDLRTYAVVPQIRRKAQPDVCLYSVQTIFL